MPLKDNKKTGGRSSVFLHMTGYVMIAVVFVLIGAMLIPQLLGYKTYYVASGSMEPEIPVGSMIYVKYTDPKELTEGDIISYDSNGAIVTHRIVKNDQNKKEITTKGDRNPTEDQRPAAYENVKGKVIFHLPYLGRLAAFLGTFRGKILLFLFGLTGMILAGYKS